MRLHGARRFLFQMLNAWEVTGKREVPIEIKTRVRDVVTIIPIHPAASRPMRDDNIDQTQPKTSRIILNDRGYSWGYEIFFMHKYRFISA